MTTTCTKTYDYIFTGTGCAGYSLLLRLLQQPLLQHKKILLIDASSKHDNDRTWCFWEIESGFFEPLVAHSWQLLQFYSNPISLPLHIAPYRYKMIRAIDFYLHAQNIVAKHSNIATIQAQVQSVGNENGCAFAIADAIKYQAQYVFNSIVFQNLQPNAKYPTHEYRLLQHFKGWKITTQQPVFNAQEATFMDFRVSQIHETTFVYVLPTSPTTALVEYTFFNQHLLPQSDYDTLLRNYLQQFWSITDCTIEETEFGIIPMTNHSFASHNGNVIHIGTAGGWTKPSSGFTFQFIQKNTLQMVQLLLKGQKPLVIQSFWKRRFKVYDATLLYILQYKKMQGKKIFTDILVKQPPQTLLRFLDSETTFWEELKIMNSVSTRVFLPAAAKIGWNFCLNMLRNK